MIITSPDDDNFKINLPLGYRFSPTHTELIVHYLKRKINNEPLPPNTIHTIMLYEFSPDYLADMLGENEENEWYVFSPRKIKSSKDARAERTTPDGHWKATSGDKSIIHNGQEVGYRKSLVYYKGKSTKAKKTKWLMEEYRLKDTPVLVNEENNNKVLHDFVLCKIHKHNRAYGNETRNGKIVEEQLDSVATGVASEDEQQQLPGNRDINLYPDQNQYFSTQIHAHHHQYSSPVLPYIPESGQQNFSVHNGLDDQCSPLPYMPDQSPDHESIESFFADWDDVKDNYSEMMGVEFC